MSGEDVDVAERGVLDTGDGASVVDQVQDVVAAAAHLGEPAVRDPAQLAVGQGQPGVDLGAAADRAVEPEERHYLNRGRSIGSTYDMAFRQQSSGRRLRSYADDGASAS